MESTLGGTKFLSYIYIPFFSFYHNDNALRYMLLHCITCVGTGQEGLHCSLLILSSLAKLLWSYILLSLFLSLALPSSPLLSSPVKSIQLNSI